MKKLFLSTAIIFFAASLSFSSGFYEELEPEPGQSAVYIGTYDWGASVEKIVINSRSPVKSNKINADDFEVKRILYPTVTNIYLKKGELKVKDAYLSDSKGNRIDGSGNFITLEFFPHPEAENLSPIFPFNIGGRFKDFFGYSIENDELDIDIMRTKGFVNKEILPFKNGKSTCTFEIQQETPENEKTEETDGKEKSPPKKITTILEYSYYIPGEKKTSDSELNALTPQEKIPLIVWFHGIGETGKSPYNALLGAKVTNLASPKIQSHFKNGVAILVPQSPTSWLETTDESSSGLRYWSPVDKNMPQNMIDIPVSKLNRLASNAISKVLKPVTLLTGEEFSTTLIDYKKINSNIAAGGKSFAADSLYTIPVKKIIDDFISEHPEIDTERILIGGCSAGGYMTMNMMIQYPDFFAAAFPICEYYLDSKITDNQILSIKDKPFWFVYAKNDGVVNPEKNTLSTVKRLRENGAANIIVKEFECVKDTSGKVFKISEERDEDKKHAHTELPYEYDGHASWIYVLNDECSSDNGLSLFDWLNLQKNSTQKK